MIKIHISEQDYLKFIEESANLSAASRFMRILGYGLMTLGLIKMSFGTIGTADIVLTGIGLMVRFIPVLSLYLQKKQFKKSEFRSDLLEEHTINLENDEISISVLGQTYQAKATDYEQFYALPSFYVIAIDEIRHLPIPKNKMDEETARIYHQAITVSE